MPVRRTKLYPSVENFQQQPEQSEDGQGAVFHAFNTYLAGLERKMTNTELTSCRVTSFNPFEVWYDKEVSQQQIDAERYAFITAQIQEAIAEDKELSPAALAAILSQAHAI